MANIVWTAAPGGGLDELAALAARCFDADGGLPLAVEKGFLRRRWTGDAVATLQGRDAGGRLVAAGAVRPGADGGTFAGMVDPEARGRGLGSFLLDWGLGEATGSVTVESESLTGEAAALFGSRGLQQVFAEDVMRIGFAAGVPEKLFPAGIDAEGWSPARFFRVYEASFRERPLFPGWSEAEWVADLTEDDEFRPEWCVLASQRDGGDVGFVTAAVGWIVQVGVVPSARGQGVAGALIAETLRRMRADGAAKAWLTVNVDNPAAELYRRLGFEHHGRRARFSDLS